LHWAIFSLRKSHSRAGGLHIGALFILLTRAYDAPKSAIDAEFPTAYNEGNSIDSRVKMIAACDCGG
jgi:hypothetical protein